MRLSRCPASAPQTGCRIEALVVPHCRSTFLVPHPTIVRHGLHFLEVSVSGFRVLGFLSLQLAQLLGCSVRLQSLGRQYEGDQSAQRASGVRVERYGSAVL